MPHTRGLSNSLSLGSYELKRHTSAISVLVLAILSSVTQYVIAEVQDPEIRITVRPSVTLLSTERQKALDPLRFSADSGYLFVNGKDMIRRYNLARRQFDMVLPIQNQLLHDADRGRSFIVDEFAVSSDGTRVAIVRLDVAELHVIGLHSGDVLYELPLPYTVGAVFGGKDFVSPMDEVFFADGDTRIVIKKHRADTHYVAELEAGRWHEIEADDFSLSKSGGLATYSSESRKVAIRASYASDPVVTRSLEQSVVSLSLSGEGDKLLLGTTQLNDGDDVVHAWYVMDTRTLNAAGEPWMTQLDGRVHWGSAWLGGRAVVLYYNEEDAGFTVVDVGEREVVFSAPYVHPSDVALSPDGRWLAMIDSDLGIVDVYALNHAGTRSSTSILPRLVPQLHSGRIVALAMSEDERVVATVGDDAWTSLWDRDSGRMFRRIDTGRRIMRLPASAESVALSRDGRRVLASSAEQFGLPTTINVWDVASGEPLQRLHDDVNTFLTFLAGDTRAMMCNSERCRVQPLPLYGEEPGTILPTGFGAEFVGQPISVSADERGIAFALNKVNVDGKGNAVSSEASVGWMELDANGQRRVIPIPGDNWVGGVAALDNSRVAAGLFAGHVLLIDGVDGKIVAGIPGYRTHMMIRSMVHLDDRRFVAGGLDYRNTSGRATIFSSDLLMLRHLLPDGLIDKPIDLLAAGGGGRWVAAASSFSNDLLLWDTEGARKLAHLRSGVIPAWRVEFQRDGHLLLVDGKSIGSLWDLKDGHVTHQFRHRESFRTDQALSALTDNTVIYVPPDEIRALMSWAPRSGTQAVSISDPSVRQNGILGGAIDINGSLIAVGISRSGEDRTIDALLISPLDSTDVAVFEVRKDTKRFGLDRVGKRILLDLGSDGLEMVSGVSGESIWRRGEITDIHDVMMFTEDRAGVVVTTVAEGLRQAITDGTASRMTGEVREAIAGLPRWWRDLLDDFAHGIPNPDGNLFVLEADTGETRFVLQNSLWRPVIPVISDGVAQDVLRLNDSLQVERVSLVGGSVVGATNLGISSLAFAVSHRDDKSDRDGNAYLVADGNGQMVLWDTKSDERAMFESSAIGPESVAFSPDGRVLAVAETDGTVSLWDVSNGPGSLQPLASLITFADGSWAVVGADGRYDASDPADLEGLNWVLPDAPTKPVPLAVFYRDYYEPRLLPRLLAGESFDEIESVSERDRKQPRVEVLDVEASEPGRVNVTVEVKRSGAGGVGDLKLFRDGRLVGLEESVGQSAQSSPGTWLVSFPDIALPTSGVEEVEFSAYAFNADGVKSDTHRLPYDDLPETQSNPGRAYVIVVGVNAYQNDRWDLLYAAEDARAHGAIVAERLEASGEYEEVHTVSLIAERGASGEITGTATRADVRAVLHVLAGKRGDAERLAAIPGAAELSKTGPDDLVYLAFSGHGLSGKNGLFHLFLSDIGEGDSRVVDEALLKSTLDSDELARLMRRVDAGDFVMVIDACNAAASVEGGGFKPGPMGSRGLGQLAYDKAMRVLAASQAEAVALESDQLKHGLLTYAMLREGLAGGAADRAPPDGAIDFTEMMNYGVERVPLLYEAIRDGSFTVQGRGFEPSCANEQDGGDQGNDCRARDITEVQRPSLFDFSRSKRDVRMPVVDGAK